MTKLKTILEFDFDDYDEATKVRLCLEVPCAVDLSHCNLITWFEAEVSKKAESKENWRILKENQAELYKVLEKRGPFLFAKYLAPQLPALVKYNRWLMRHTVWHLFNSRQNSGEDSEETSIVTIIDTAELLADRSLPSTVSPVASVVARQSVPFEFDLDSIITSTQQS